MMKKSHKGERITGISDYTHNPITNPMAKNV